MSIQKFYQSAVANDFARQFQFRVDQMYLGLPAGNVAMGGTSPETTLINWKYEDPGETIYIETAALPGRIVNNIPVPFMGLSFNVPGAASFPGSANYAVRFRCDQNYAIRNQLEKALVDLFNISQTAGNYPIPAPNNYLTFTLFGKTQDGVVPKPVRTYTLVGVYVQSLQDAQYDVKDNGTVAMIDAVLAYQYWRVSAKTEQMPQVVGAAPSGRIDKGTPIT